MLERHRSGAALPIAHQPLLYVVAPSLSRLQIGAKRAFDIAVAAGMLVVLAPVMAIVAALIKLEDRGPVLFRQQRVGQGGGEFGMIKLRSMCIDTEAKLAALRADKERSGPLFELDGGDPRVTRIGRFLRATSLDELPQLFNVLRGDMSLVGPRPALASEVAEFAEELLAADSPPAGAGCTQGGVIFRARLRIRRRPGGVGCQHHRRPGMMLAMRRQSDLTLVLIR